MIVNAPFLMRYLNLEDETPNILRGAINLDVAEVKAALVADPDCINHADPDTGLTALHIAAANGDIETIQMLVQQSGVDIGVPDALGRPPYLLAQIMGRNDVVGALFQQVERRLQAKEATDDQPTESTNVRTITSFRPKRPSGP